MAPAPATAVGSPWVSAAASWQLGCAPYMFSHLYVLLPICAGRDDMAPSPATAVGSHLYVRHDSHLYVRGGVTWPLLLPLQWGLLGCQRLHLGSLGVHLIYSLT